MYYEGQYKAHVNKCAIIECPCHEYSNKSTEKDDNKDSDLDTEIELIVGFI